jgi:hypothetical protein
MHVKSITKTIGIEHKKVHNDTIHAQKNESVEFMADEICTVKFRNGQELDLDGLNPSSISFTDKGHHKYDVVYPNGSRAVPTGDIIVP